jgi:DNA-binding GntR family transcriptional regulator
VPENAFSNVLRIAEPIVPQIIQHLRQAIIGIELKPGEALSEKEIALRFGVSRQPVREAFIKLAEAGLVQILPHRGTYVTKISVREVLNARFVREAVECAVVRAAADLATGADLARLDTLLDEQRRYATVQDRLGFKESDEAFHRALVEIVECDYALKAMDAARAQTDRVRYLSLPDASPLHLLIDQHAAIVEAVRAGDANRAEAAMRVHLREILSALPQLAAAYPDLFDGSAPPAHVRPAMREPAR